MDDRNNMSRRDKYNSSRKVSPGGYASRLSREKNTQQDEVVENFRERDNVLSRSGFKRTTQNNNEEKARNRISKVRKPNSNKKVKIAKTIFKWGLAVGSVLFIILFSVCMFWIYQAPAFDSKVLENNNKTIVYDINNEEVAKLGNKIGDNVTKKDIPEAMQNAILATEDNRFFEHGAVDYKRLVGAVFSNITNGFGVQGASTISQQLIKRAYLDENKSMKRKVQEAYLAYKLEQNYDKDSIFTMYLNRIYYSDGVYGLKTAAKYYYGKNLNELTLPQMALLAGLPQQPNRYNPYDNQQAAKERRDTVLYLMQYHGKITKQQEEEAKKVPIMTGIVERDANSRGMLSSEFDERYTGYMNEVVRELKNSKEYKDYEGDILNLGLKVYTNFNPKIQDSLSNSMNKNQAGLKAQTEVAMVVLDNNNSGISALYGGRNLKFAGFNFATQSKLQPGSSIKPVLAYAPAVEYLGWSTNHIINDKKIEGSQIQNWDRVYHGNIPMNYALMMSYNIPAIKTFYEVGFNKVKQYASTVGLEVKDDSPTTAIGGSSDGYSPLQMAGAYVPFSNGGYYATPKAIKKVFDSSGVEIKSFSKDDRKQVLKDTTAYIMTSMLRNVVNGIAQSARVSGAEMGVKTGTTTFSVADGQKYNFDPEAYSKDSWVIGYTTDYTLAVWQGFASIDGPTKKMDVNDGVKTQILYRINMQNIINMKRPKAFTVPKSVGTYNGGVKVLTDDERRQVEEEQRRKEEDKRKEAEEKKAKEEANKDKDNSKQENSESSNNNSSTTTRPANNSTNRNANR